MYDDDEFDIEQIDVDVLQKLQKNKRDTVF